MVGVPRLGESAEKRRVLCARLPGNELVAAECRALCGGAPDADGVAEARRLDRLVQAAYLKGGYRVLAEGTTLSELVEHLRKAPPGDTDRFRLDLLRLSGPRCPPRQEAIVAVGRTIPGTVQLENPRVRLVLVQQERRWWLGRWVVGPDGSYRRHRSKPWQTSSSLPARLARALVNLVPLGTRRLLDPCCGTGSILLEAAAVGLEPVGLDWNKKMVGMSRANLAHFGYSVPVHHADARTWSGPADAIVTDLPYGKNLRTTEKLIAAILANCVRLAPFAVYVATQDLSPVLRAVGYSRVERWAVPKNRGFVRFVHCCRRELEN